jgi:hypothetical protein
VTEAPLRPFGGDRLKGGAGDAVTLRSVAAKGWKARGEPIGPRRTFHPGTAVSWDGRVFEVVERRPGPAGGVEYVLAPWRDDLAIRSLERYDESSERERTRERAWRVASIRKRRLAVLLSPILGHLPGQVQARMEFEFGAPAITMTVVSALPLLAIGIVGSLASFARLAGGSLAPLPEPPAPLSIYLLAESALRLSVAISQSRPAGSIPGALLYEVGRLVARALHSRS